MTRRDVTRNINRNCTSAVKESGRPDYFVILESPNRRTDRFKNQAHGILHFCRGFHSEQAPAGRPQDSPTWMRCKGGSALRSHMTRSASRWPCRKRQQRSFLHVEARILPRSRRHCAALWCFVHSANGHGRDRPRDGPSCAIRFDVFNCDVPLRPLEKSDHASNGSPLKERQ